MPSKPITTWAVLDHSTLRYVVAPDTVEAHSPAGEVLARLPRPDGDHADAAWQRRVALALADAALDQGRVVRETSSGAQRCGVALYNPHTYEVALGSLPGTRSFTDSAPITLDRFGTAAELAEDGLVVDGRLLAPAETSREHLVAAFAAHHA